MAAVTQIDTRGVDCYTDGMAIRATVNVSITPELEQFVQDLVASGRYNSASEVFREGLRLLEHAERHQLLEKWLVEGLTPKEQSRVPVDLLDKARSQIEAKIQEGLDAVACERVIDGQEFLSRWRTRLAATPRTAPQHRSRARRKA